MKTSEETEHLRQYWRRNLRILAVLLGIWLLVSCFLSIFFAKELNTYRLGGFKLGFWFAQQGAIYVFLALIVIYVRQMNKLDKEFDVDEK
jgi:putative solute:sodium symporter small subunit